MKEKLGEMELFECVDMGSSDMVRAPGGWVYKTYGRDGYCASSAFIPFSKEFANEEVEVL